MKILFVDKSIFGHHAPYFKAVTRYSDYESVLCIPQMIENLNIKQIIVKNSNFKSRNYIQYCRWIKEIKTIADLEKPDVIHFLYGDIFYRYFGLGLSKFKKYKTIITFHHIKKSFIRDISIKRIFSQINTGIVHTNTLLTQLIDIGIKNIKHIENPHYFNFENITREYAIKTIGLNDDAPVLLAIAGTRYDKGLDILLNALKKVNKPFLLLIAGKELYFDRNFIEENIETYKNKVKILLRYLSDQEFYMCIKAADIIVLPYRRIFTGASGPLAEGVWLKKTIIGPNHGSLGSLIKDNHLGATFKTEDVDDLAKVISEQLESKHSRDETAENYRLTISTDRFALEHKNLYHTLINI
jgi:glycosyltransferase involved in cell wall biosynthesis